jgi:hypothetical protein
MYSEDFANIRIDNNQIEILIENWPKSSNVRDLLYEKPLESWEKWDKPEAYFV